MDEVTIPARLSDADSLLWRIESDPVLRSPIVVVALLDGSPTPDRVADAVGRAAAVVPRLRQRIEPAPLGLGHPRWVDAGSALDDRVRRVRAPGDDLAAVLQVVEPDAAAAFDPARPPWTLTVVDGLDGGRAAAVLRFHHAITDGVGGIEIADRLFDRRRRGPDPGPASAPALQTAAQPAAATLAAAAAGAVRGGLAAAAHPGAAVTSTWRLARSVRRLLAPAGGDPALPGRSLARRLAVIDRPLDEVRAAGRAAGGTVNAVLLAAVAGGAQRYLATEGRSRAAIRVTMPISIRRPGDALGGNRFVPARFALPLDEPDPTLRVRMAGALIRSWRAEPAVGSSDLLAAVLGLLPPPAATRLFGGMLRASDLDVVDVPGLDRRAFLAGARVERLWAFAPPTGAAASVTLVSHGGMCGIGVNCDRRAIADPDRLTACLDGALTEVLALGCAGPVAGGERRSA